MRCDRLEIFQSVRSGFVAGHGVVHIFPPRTSLTVLKAAAANPTVAITAQKSGTLRSRSTAAAKHRAAMKTHVGVVPLGEPTGKLLRNLLVQIFAALPCRFLVSARPCDRQEKRALFKSFDVMRQALILDEQPAPSGGRGFVPAPAPGCGRRLSESKC